MVVPNGTLFGDGVCARIKHELLTEFNLHTIVRLPNGVFAPYTCIPTNLLFFDCSGPTKTIWYYEQPLPEGRKNYSKTKPIQYEEFADCLKWWGKRKENGRAWKVKASDASSSTTTATSVNLDIKNPNAAEALEHLPPEQLVESILAKGTADRRDHGRDQGGPSWGESHEFPLGPPGRNREASSKNNPGRSRAILSDYRREMVGRGCVRTTNNRRVANGCENTLASSKRRSHHQQDLGATRINSYRI